jgi:predicted nucleic acid-binding protein
MNGFLLDTNIPSELVRSQPEPKVKTWIAAQSLEALFMSAVSFGELRKGVILRAPGKRRTELESWMEADLSILFFRSYALRHTIHCRTVGALEAERQLAGRPLNMADGLIAATALEHGLTLVTRNVRDFSELGVTLFNPWEAT